VTIVTEGRREVFGEIVDDEMRLSARGRIADSCWRLIPQHFPLVELGAFIIMPNHVHGILVFHDGAAIQSPPVVGARHVVPPPRFGKPSAGSLATVVQQYKASVTRRIRMRPGAAQRVWQRNYYEHVIRNDADWNRMDLYIESNPRDWEDDEEHPNRARI
jgi:REP element-mobilizing transposase RayT